MNLAHPNSEIIARIQLRRVFGNVDFEMGSADFARVKLCEELDELFHVLLLFLVRMFVVAKREGMQKAPGEVTENFARKWALSRRYFLLSSIGFEKHFSARRLTFVKLSDVHRA